MSKKTISRFVILVWALFFFTGRAVGQFKNAEDRYIYSRVFEMVKYSVVSILVEANEISELGLPEEISGGGSGFIIDSIGTVITNKHVVKSARRVRVRFNNIDVFDAKIIGVAPDIDLAVLRIVEPPIGLKPIVLGDSDSLKIGEKILVIGSPLGFDATLTHGIVSSIRRLPEPDKSMLSPHLFIQVDAAINRGNSGGPLVNLLGEMVGVATMTIDPRIGSGISFAIPANVVKQVVQDIIERRRPTSNWIGITVTEINEQIIRAFRLQSRDGLFISRVEPGSPAEIAGLRQGFLLIKIEGVHFKNEADWEWFLRNQNVGAKIRLTISKPPYTTQEIIIVEVKEKPVLR